MENTEGKKEPQELTQKEAPQTGAGKEQNRQTSENGTSGKAKTWFKGHSPLAAIKKHKKITALVLVVVVVVAAVGTHLSSKKKQMANMMSQQAVSTTELKKQDLKNTIAVNGTIASDTSRSISANVSNVEISEVCVSVGDEVKAGDVLCVLDSSSLEKSKAIAQKEQSASKAKASMNTASAARELANTVETSQIQSSRNQEKIDKASDSYDSAVAEDNAAYESYEQALAAQQANEQTKTDAQNQMNSAQSSMSSAQSQMEAASANFASALRELQSASSTDESFTSVTDVNSDLGNVSTQGDDDASAVAAGVSQLSSYQDAYNSASSAYTSAKTTYDTANASYTAAANQTDAYEKAVTEAYSQHKQAEASVSTAADAYDQAVENKEDSDRSNAQSIAQRQDSLKSAQIDQGTTGLQNEVTLDNYTTQIEDCNVIAPFDGIITSVSVEAGDNYNGSEICVLQDNANLIVSLSVDEYDIPDIAKGMEAVIKTDATGDEEMSGTVTFVAPTPTTSTGSSSGTGSSSSTSTSSGYAVEVTINNPSERLRLGMTAKTSIITEEVTDVFVVPYECVETAPDGTKTITVVDTDQSGAAGQDSKNSQPGKDGQNAQSNQRTIQVETGLETDYYIEISSDELTEGMQVVVPQTTSSSSSDMMIMPDGGGDMGGGGAPGGGGMGGSGPM